MMDYYKNIIGYEPIKEKLNTLADYIANPERFSKFNARPKRFIMLEGGPGVGKTSLAQAFAKSVDLTTFQLRKKSSRKEFLDELDKVVTDAIEQSPSLIIMDDVDKYLSDDFGNEYFVLQSHLDNISESGKDVYVVATINNNDMPSSLERRFDIIYVGSPNKSETEQIVRYYIKQKGFISKNIDYDDVVRLFAFNSCADIETVITEAAVLAAKKQKEKVEMSDLITVFLKRNKIAFSNIEDSASDDDLWQICVHEAGHIIGLIALDKHGVEGFAYSIAHHEQDREPTGLVARYYSHSDRESHIIELLAAPMAVSEFFGIPDIGGEKDYDTAIDIVFEQACVVDSGMRGVRPERNSKNSDNYQRKIEDIVHYELERYKHIARSLVHNNRNLIEELAKALYEKNYLLYSDVKEIASKYEILK